MMRVVDAVRRSAVGIGPDRTIAEAAQIMNDAGVGALARPITAEVLFGHRDSPVPATTAAS